MAEKKAESKTEAATAAPKIAQDTKDKQGLKAVTYEELVKEYGQKLGEEKYFSIAEAGGFGQLRGEATGYRPSLDLVSLNQPVASPERTHDRTARREKIEKILAAKSVEDIQAIEEA